MYGKLFEKKGQKEQFFFLFVTIAVMFLRTQSIGGLKMHNVRGASKLIWSISIGLENTP